ncbi:hypothetical protein ACF3NT_03365 [Naumannella halotolerans]|uniref:Uncharacterized protein n=1 Tax=Naumannella halotolerans TaxID=993414 RepID=A0A4R7J759_9ACTN|nr:hypothetical protein [Naumannella halotolerans]TDT33094.1 hypothetical protein CLV29_0695 [Naumannella halotolerans]
MNDSSGPDRGERTPGEGGHRMTGTPTPASLAGPRSTGAAAPRVEAEPETTGASRNGDPQDAPRLTDPPHTGEPEVDAVLAELGELATDPAQVQAQLSRAHEALQEIINRRGQ